MAAEEAGVPEPSEREGEGEGEEKQLTTKSEQPATKASKKVRDLHRSVRAMTSDPCTEQEEERAQR